MKNKNFRITPNYTIALFLYSGIFICLLALLYNEFLFKMLRPDPPLPDIVIDTIRKVQIKLIMLGLLLIGLSELIKRSHWLKALSQKDIITNITLSILMLLIPLTLLELCLQPLAVRGRSRIYLEDSELGWVLRPNTDDMYAGVRVHINGKGLVGPELSYQKPDGVFRILYLGDSVTFGYGVSGYQYSFPYLVEAHLEEITKSQIETINAGVAGYTLWQEHILLSRECFKYNPDLIVLSFVLNDVTEMLLIEEDNFLNKRKNAVFINISQYNRFIYNSGIYYLMRELRKKFSNYDQHLARSVLPLMSSPDRPDVRRAWDIALKDLKKISDFCIEKNTPLLVVCIPYKLQLGEMQLNYDIGEIKENLFLPQSILNHYAEENEIPFVDLLPGIRNRMEREKANPRDIMFDFCHPTLRGYEYIAKLIAEYLLTEYFNIDTTVAENLHKTTKER